MAAKKQDKSSKTAHVLNLLTKPADKAEAEAAAPAQSRGAAPPKEPLVPPILQPAHEQEEDISVQIRDALAEELAAALGAAPLEADLPDLQPEEPPAQMEARADAAPRGQVAPPAEKRIGSNLVYLNIMQTLVEAAAPRFMKMFNVCSCPHCTADVKALALTRLKPQYAVFRREDSIPMLTLYETRYSSLVAAELTKACETVKAYPRHNK